MKDDEAFGLVWRRETKLFSSMSTPIDAFYVQHYLPGKNDLRSVRELDPKEVRYIKTVVPIMPENFLKEYGGIQDENVLSIQNIIGITDITEAKKKYDEVMARAKQLPQPCVSIRPSNRRRFRF